jgi:hypothetical protein
MATIQITEVTGTEMYHRYPGQTSAQGCYVELDARNGHLTASYNAEIGNARPVEVYHGHVQRWSIPVLKSNAANALLEQIRPFAARVCAGYESEWNGSNHVASFDIDAQDAIDSIVFLCSGNSPDDELEVWEASDWLYGMGSLKTQREALGIESTTTDEELGAIEQQLLEHAESDDVDKVEGLAEHLKRLRDEARNESREGTESHSATI